MQDVRTWLESLRTRVLMMIVRGLVPRVRYAKEPVDGEDQVTKSTMQLVQIEGLKGEVLSEVENPQIYGLASRVRDAAGAECVAASVAGDRARTVALLVYDRKVGIRLKPGEVALYGDQGQVVRLHADGRISVKSPIEVRVHAPKLVMAAAGMIETAGTVQGGIVHGGEVKDNHPTTPSLQAMRLAYNQHTHGSSPLPSPQM